MRVFLIIFLFVLELLATKTAAFAGGIATIDLGKLDYEPKIYFDDKRVRVDKDKNGNYKAVVGIPLSAKGEKTLFIEERQGDSTITTAFSLVKKSYPVQRIYMKDDKFIHPNEEELKRIEKERKEIREHFEIYSEAKSATKFAMPIKAKVTGAFGRERYFNDEPRAPHSGADFAAPKGTKVTSAQNGEVVLTGDYFFCGKFVLVDHGKGFMSLYCHLDKIIAQKNQFVKQGDLIGLVGSTGRATGAHLHWSAVLNSVFVDPLLLVPASLSAKKAK